MRQEVAGVRYQTYIHSRAWFARRARWATDHVTFTGKPLACAGCGIPWTLATGDLHHVTYERLGAEMHFDLTAVCRACHTAIHQGIATTYRRHPRDVATALILASIREKVALP